MIYYSCKDKTTQPAPGFDGITETLNDPTPIGTIDADDWQPMMDCSTLTKVIQISSVSDTIPVVNPDTTHLPKCTKIYPAYPNPTSRYFTVQYSLSAADSVYMTVNDSPTHIVKEIVKERKVRGMYSVTIDALDLNSAIYRVYITVFRQTDVLHSYGDIKIVK